MRRLERNKEDVSPPVFDSNLTIEEKSKKYRGLNFELIELGLTGGSGDFKPYEKKRMLEILSWVKFVVNTEEFKTAILSKELESQNRGYSRTIEGNSIDYFEPLDRQKTLDTFLYYTGLSTSIYMHHFPSQATEGIASYPDDDVFLYLEDIDNPKMKEIKHYFEGHSIKVTARYYNLDINLIDIGKTIVHEMMHNIGHHHKNNYTARDPAYVYGNTFKEVVMSKGFEEKYKEEFENFLPYYEEIYKKFYDTETTNPLNNSKEIFRKMPHTHGNYIECSLEH